MKTNGIGTVSRSLFAATLIWCCGVVGSRGAEPGERLVLAASADTVRAVAFSPDGLILATGGYDNVLRLWDAAARPGPPTPRPAVALEQPITAERILAEVEKLGGQVQHFATRPAAPMTRVDFRETDLDDADLERLHLAVLDDLRLLDLSETEVTDAGLAHLKGLTHLQVRNLGGTDVTDAGLLYLGDMRELASLTLPRGVSDAGLAHLSGLGALRDLNLAETQVTEAGAASLRKLKNLKSLTLSTRISESPIAELRKTLPGVRIVQ